MSFEGNTKVSKQMLIVAGTAPSRRGGLLHTVVGPEARVVDPP